ncbi:DNA endonuclease RBBP8 [Silurus asotus]|uniref:DNA endonuclease RBBP8 n=1 Tax=Silurus asotus TaxID=30991 RepID=A0AAD5FP23_SILAS|nr:DNA endonuclease RBBP8 [Silurus asotus]
MSSPRCSDEVGTPRNSEMFQELLQRLRDCHDHTIQEPEEGVIPDSPKQPLSFPVVNKMKRKRDQSNIRYAEKRPSPPLPDPQRRTVGYAGAVLVPETCDLDVTFIPKSDTKRHGRTLVPESCRLDLNSQQMSESDDEDEGIGQKANDSLAHIFDTTGHEEYESCPQSCPVVEENEEEEECEEQELGRGDEVTEEVKCLDELHPDGDADESAQDRSVAHVVVVRKKAERRKLHGHTCKECEIYYADLPEDERRKKLSSCSRHRYRYIPPSTPENFWDVGFPSTQTCVERGYIKEDNQADPRSRRRRPYHAMFSPKAL